MNSLDHLKKNNRDWADKVQQDDPDFFKRLAAQQKPEYLWRGCSGSRVPANKICGLAPGEVFVHRNVANQVVHTDMNCISVVEYAVQVLKVKHIIICGHYRCGGVEAAVGGGAPSLVGHWIRHIRDIYEMHSNELDNKSNTDISRRMCEINVVEQVRNLATSPIILDAWASNQQLAIHGWIYDINDGLVHDTNATLTSGLKINAQCDEAIKTRLAI